jgi:hypothetical protein
MHGRTSRVESSFGIDVMYIAGEFEPSAEDVGVSTGDELDRTVVGMTILRRSPS